MTIDATRSPTPAWQKTLIGVLLAAFIVVVGYFLWTHELHHGAKANPPAANPPAAVQPAPASPSHSTATPSTTIPGGLPISPRDPFPT